MLVIAGRNGINRRGKVIDNGTLQVLRLKTFSGPTACGSPVISESATHAIVGTSAGEQGIDFLSGSLSAAKPELERTLYPRRQLCLFEQFLNGLAAKRLHDAALILQPLQEPRDLVNSGDGAGGELGEFGVDFGCRSLCNSACSFGELPIDMEPTLINPAAERP